MRPLVNRISLSTFGEGPLQWIFDLKAARRSRIYAGVVTALADLFVIGSIALFLPLLELNRAEWRPMAQLAGFLLMIYVIAGIIVGAYEPASFRGRRLYVGRAMRALILTFGVIFLAFFSLKISEDYSRLMIALLAVLALPGVAIGRIVLFPLLSRLLEKAAVSEIVILDGVEMQPRAGAMILDVSHSGLRPDLADRKSVEQVAALSEQVERIIVHCVPERRQAWADILKCVAVRSEICMPELNAMRPLSLDRFDSSPTLIVSDHPLRWHQLLVKRLFDICLTSFALLVLSPLLVVTAIAICIESPGPALFRQQRLGFGNRSFVILKFRSMRQDQLDTLAEKLTERNDPRVTRIGAFIRRTSIDELPQLFNVLVGDMSLVGPRPHAPAALAGDKLYWEVDAKYWHRHRAKPGITGLAQVRGFRGNTFEETDLQSRLDADLEYVSDWSLLRDIEILFATLRVIVHHKAF